MCEYAIEKKGQLATNQWVLSGWWRCESMLMQVLLHPAVLHTSLLVLSRHWHRQKGKESHRDFAKVYVEYQYLVVSAKGCSKNSSFELGSWVQSIVFPFSGSKTNPTCMIRVYRAIDLLLKLSQLGCSISKSRQGYQPQSFRCEGFSSTARFALGVSLCSMGFKETGIYLLGIFWSI